MKNRKINLGLASIIGLGLLSLTTVSCNNDDNKVLVTKLRLQM
jgi:hypothetical protein